MSTGSKEELMKTLAQFGSVVQERVPAMKLKTGVFPNIHKPIDLMNEDDRNLIESLRKNGLLMPCVTDENYNVIDCHRRLEALDIIYGGRDKVPDIPILRVVGLNCEKDMKSCIKLAWVLNTHRRGADEAQTTIVIQKLADELGCKLVVNNTVNSACIDMIADVLGATSTDKEYIIRLVNQMIVASAPRLTLKPEEIIEEEEEEEQPPQPEQATVTQWPSDEVLAKIMETIKAPREGEETEEEETEEEERRSRTEMEREMAMVGRMLGRILGVTTTEAVSLRMMLSDPKNAGKVLEFLLNKCYQAKLCR